VHALDDLGHRTMKKFFLSREQIKQLIPANLGACLITDRVMVDGLKIGYMYRAEPHNPRDSGWHLFAGDESQSYVDEPSNLGLYAVNTAANYNPDIIPYLETPAPCAFEKVAGSNKYRRVEQ
jgi:hypothetical protein